MSTDIVTTIIAASGAIILAGASYWFTKQRERDAELRREKLEHYKEYAVCLSSVLSGEGTPEGKQAYALACNKLNLVAPQAVLKALQNFQQATKDGNSSTTLEHHDKLMSLLFYEMRKDLGISPKDSAATFHVGLWASAGISHGETLTNHSTQTR
jgi:hypothetical protein